MNASELFIKDGKSAGVWYCGKCHIVHRTQDEAEKCCNWKCETCGKETRQFWTKCDDCRNLEFEVKETRKEKERFAAAEKVTGYSGWVYCDGLGEDGFFETADDLIDHCECTGDELPEYAWACDPTRFAVISIDQVLEQIGENEDAYPDFDVETLDGLPALKMAIEKFNETNKGVVSYTPNHRKAVLIQKP